MFKQILRHRNFRGVSKLYLRGGHFLRRYLNRRASSVKQLAASEEINMPSVIYSLVTFLLLSLSFFLFDNQLKSSGTEERHHRRSQHHLPTRPDNLSFHNSKRAPGCSFGATKEFLNYKYIYINIPGLYSSRPPNPSTHFPLVLIISRFFFLVQNNLKKQKSLF